MIWVFKRDITEQLGLAPDGSQGRTEKNFRYCIDNERCCAEVARVSREKQHHLLEFPIVHDLKCHPGPFQALVDGLKTFEFRKNDRNFKVGDYLRLREWVPSTSAYTCREARRLVTYVLHGQDFGVPEDHVVMSISENWFTGMGELLADAPEDEQGGSK
jgi:ParB family chromosome partitioning protein